MIVIFIVQFIAIFVAAYYLVLPYVGYLTVFMVPLVMALLASILSLNSRFDLGSRQKKAIFVALLTFTGSIIGGFISRIVYDPDYYTAAWYRIPDQIDRDISRDLLLVTVNRLLKPDPILSDNGFQFILMTALIAAILAGLLSLIKKYYLQTFAPWVLVFIIGLLLIVNLEVTVPEFRSLIKTEISDGIYYYDGATYLKAYYLMSSMNYYPAYVKAFENKGDEPEVDAIKNGKFDGGYVSNPAYFREPFIFYFWRALSPASAIGIYYLSLMICVALLYFSYYSLRSIAGEGAVLSSFALLPYFFSGMVWTNMFLPDWWAGLAVLASLLFYLRRQHSWAAFFMFIAVLCREVLFPFLLIMIFVSWMNDRGKVAGSERKANEDDLKQRVSNYIKDHEAILSYALAAVAFAVIYPFHYVAASAYIAQNAEAKIGLGSLISFSWDNFTASTSYLMHNYGMLVLPGYLFIFAALILFILLKRRDLAIIVLFLVPYFLLAKSTYWGLHFLPFIVAVVFTAATMIYPALCDIRQRRNQGNA